MDYLKNLIAFNTKVEDEDFLPGASQLLWYKLMAINNRCGMTYWFEVDDLSLMSKATIKSRTTFIKHRKILIDKGYIECKALRWNTRPKYHIVRLYDEK